jgi:pyruvate formate lyase activating enzyme
MIGRIHSIETCGTVDGPGIRFVLFLQGCPLRCKFCHNPDTWNVNAGKEMTVDHVVTEILKYKSYMNFSGGGLTVTGGEPLLQIPFLTELLKRCKENGVHTALDTSGAIFNDAVKKLLDYVDLVLLDIKNFDPTVYKELTSVNLDPTLDFLTYLNEQSIDTWLRYVLVPTWTDNFASVESLSLYLSHYGNIKQIEILPFHKMGEYKWKELNLTYELSDVNEPSKDMINQVIELFKKHNPGIAISS